MSVSSLPEGLYDDCKTQMLNKFAVAHKGVNVLTCKEFFFSSLQTLKCNKFGEVRWYESQERGCGIQSYQKGEK